MAISLASFDGNVLAAISRGDPVNKSEFQMEWVGLQHPDRADLQSFIADVFYKMYGAEVRHFCDTLIGCRGKDAQWIAALGFSLARDGTPLFLEQYLDASLESEIAARTGLPVGRHHIVEIGNMAAVHAGAVRELTMSMTRVLHQQGLNWVAFTATRCILNSFTRLRLKPILLVDADPRRLPDGGKSWGSYYETKPKVMFGDIRSGYAQLVK